MPKPPSPAFPADYAERVYAGVLGKLIGVYLGRPFEGWRYERILKELGEVAYYVHERLGKALVVTDDDVSGTFTFLRALEDFGYDPKITAREIGRTWLNYIVEKRAVLWWGGMGTSTEHTAFVRLKSGIDAPMSGSRELNGQVVSEQIGSQIFIDGWGMVSPGNPEQAARLAREASLVSHDGEAVYGAQIVAAMEAQAFVEPDMDKLFDTALEFIPADCTIRRLIGDIRNWRAQDNDWHKTFPRIQGAYGYDKFGGGCHMVPNHAVIVLALCYAPDDFQRGLLIANTAGWDTDCNSGNVGCLLGIKLGLAGLEAGPDWRGPIADRLYLPTADGGRCITDAAAETRKVVEAGCRLAGKEPPPAPKDGARFHFAFPGSVQGWRFDERPECKCAGTVWNAGGKLAIGYGRLAPGRFARAATPTFIVPERGDPGGYQLLASPTLYPGQSVRARLHADPSNRQAVAVRLFLRHYDGKDGLVQVNGPDRKLAPGQDETFAWTVPACGGQPIAEIGVEIASDARADGTVYLDGLSWDGAPNVELGLPEDGGTMWQKAWVHAADRFWHGGKDRPYAIAQEAGVGLAIQGERAWSGYEVAAEVKPHLARQAGIACCVQGLKRYYALVLEPGGKVKLVKERYGRTVLAEAACAWQLDEVLALKLQTRGGDLAGFVNGKKVLSAEDQQDAFAGGAVALLCEEGRVDFGAVRVRPME